MRSSVALAFAVSLSIPGFVHPGPFPGAPGVGDAPRSDTVLAVVNATIHPVAGPVIPSGTLVVRNGRVEAVGSSVEVPRGATVVNARGRHLIPGIVESHSHMGFKRLWRPATGADNNELSKPVNAEVRALDGLNTSDPGFRAALASGVTTMNVTTGSRSPNSGQAAVLKLRGGTAAEMFFAHGGMKFAIRATGQPGFPEDIQEVDSILRDALSRARSYLEAREEWRTSGREGEPPARDLRLEALGRLLTREWPVGVHSHSVEQMRIAVGLADDFDLDLYIHHGDGTHALAGELAEKGIPVSFGPVLPFRATDDEVLRGPVRLAEMGGLVAFHQDHPDGFQYYLRPSASLFVRRGMPEEDALAALTVNGARIFHLEDRIGTLEPGKDADFVLLDGPPLEFETLVDAVWVEGRKVYDRAADWSVFDDQGTATTLRPAERPGSGAGFEAVPASAGPSGEELGRDGADRGSSAAGMGTPRRARSGTLVIRGGTVLPASGPAIEDGIVVVRDGKIAAVGRGIPAPADARVIDARDRVVTPGIIEARTPLGSGVWEEERLVAPDRRVVDTDVLAEAPEHPWITTGVTAVYLSPGPESLLGGLGAVVKLGVPMERQVVAAEAGMSASFGESALDAFDDRTTRQGMVGLLRQRLVDARRYAAARRGEGGGAPSGDPELEALTRVLDGDVPLRVVANTPDDIATALRLAGEFGVRVVVDVGAGAHRVAAKLAKAGVPVVVGPSILGIGGGGPAELYAHTPANAARLHDAGVTLALSTDGGFGRSVTMEAAVARGHGLPDAAALRAVTLDAARILGVADRLGSIEAGKDADLVVWDGEPLSTWGEAAVVIVDGEVVFSR